MIKVKKYFLNYNTRLMLIVFFFAMISNYKLSFAENNLLSPEKNLINHKQSSIIKSINCNKEASVFITNSKDKTITFFAKKDDDSWIKEKLIKYGYIIKSAVLNTKGDQAIILPSYSNGFIEIWYKIESSWEQKYLLNHNEYLKLSIQIKQLLDVSFSKDDKYIATMTDKSIVVWTKNSDDSWNVEKGGVISAKNIESYNFSEDCNHVIAYCSDGVQIISRDNSNNCWKIQEKIKVKNNIANIIYTSLDIDHILTVNKEEFNLWRLQENNNWLKQNIISNKNSEKPILFYLDPKKMRIIIVTSIIQITPEQEKNIDCSIKNIRIFNYNQANNSWEEEVPSLLSANFGNIIISSDGKNIMVDAFNDGYIVYSLSEDNSWKKTTFLEKWFTKFKFSPNNQYLICYNFNKLVLFYRYKNSDWIKCGTIENNKLSNSKRLQIESADFTPDSNYIFITNFKKKIIKFSCREIEFYKIPPSE